MALYQPSNITPSTFAGIGGAVVDVNDYVSISWQVNGTSGMIGFDFDIYENTPESALIQHKSYTRMDPGGGGPFYGTDAQGNVKIYVLDLITPVTWASWGLTNGNSYKLKITQKWKNDPYDADEPVKSVVQNSESVFITRAAPSLSVSPASGTLTSVSQTFTGVYSQEQGDAVSWVRWILKNASGEVLDDTGTIYTGILSYTYDGFFSGETYSLECTAQTSSGAEVSVTNNYAVSYVMAEQIGEISLVCNPDDSVTLSWGEGVNIPGVPSAQDYGTISGGVLHLAAERSILWNTVNGEDMAFPSPYCFAWKGQITGTATDDDTVSSGTWTRVKTYPQSHSTDVSHTTPTSAWTRNPNVSDSEVRKVNTTITVNTAHTTAGSFISTESPLSVALSTGDYAYKTSSSPAPVITVANNISSYSITQAAYIGDDDIRRPLTDAYIETVQDGNRLIFTVYSNNILAYLHKIIVYADVTYVDYYYGTKTESPVTGDTGIYNPFITSSSNLSNARIIYYNNTFTIYAEANSPNTYLISYQYTHRVSPSNLYMATWSGTQSTGTLTSASIKSTTATGGANVRVSGNTYSVTEYSSDNTLTASTVVTLNYTTQEDGPESYQSVVEGTRADATSVALVSTTATRAAVTMSSGGRFTVTMYNGTASSCSAVLRFTVPSVADAEDFAELTDGTDTAYFSLNSGELILSVNGTEEESFGVPDNAKTMVVSLSGSIVTAIFFDADGTIIQYEFGFSPTAPSPISGVTLNGPQDCEYAYISKNRNLPLSRPDYTPVWDGDTLFYASFASDLQAGTVSSGNADSVAIYRRSGTLLEPVGAFGANVRSVRDYAFRSGISYTYELFYVSGGLYSAGTESAPMCSRFRQHTLIEAEEDAERPGVYHPVNVWRFRDNLDAGAYTNQNQPVLLDNFTKYPLWQPSSPAAKAGTLTALLGRFVNGAYTGDSAEIMEKLFALSSSVNPLFYRDMKGNLYMVRLAGPIAQTVDNRTGELAVSVSVPWVEVGSADGVKIYTVTEG